MQALKSMCLNPSNDNALKMFCTDAIGRNKDVVCFCDMLGSLEDCCTISLDGLWGSGKTFFVKQAQMLLDYFNETTETDENTKTELESYFCINENQRNKLKGLEPYATVYYDAWENDNDIDPILSLMYAMLKADNAGLSSPKKHSALKIAGVIVDIATGKNVSNFFKAIKGENITEEIEQEKSIYNLMQEFIELSICEHGNRLAIFIDELDRCKPTYTVQMLERIKHFFNDDRVTFIFSINSEQLQHTVKNYYGQGFNASRYLDKFFDLRVSLPEVNIEKYMQELNYGDTQYTYDRMGLTVIKYFNFQMREIAKYLRLLKISAYKCTHSSRSWDWPEEKAVGFCLLYIVPILLGIKIYDAGKYHDFIEGRNGEIMIDILSLPEVRLNNKGWIYSKSVGVERGDGQAVEVPIEARLKEIYEAVFASTDWQREISIGEMSFERNIKNTVLTVAGLLSDYASFE